MSTLTATSQTRVEITPADRTILISFVRLLERDGRPHTAHERLSKVDRKVVRHMCNKLSLQAPGDRCPDCVRMVLQAFALLDRQYQRLIYQLEGRDGAGRRRHE